MDEDLDEAAREIPAQWQPDLSPLRLAVMCDFYQFDRCCLYGDSIVKSKAWEASKTRDDRWIVFQHHLHEYGLVPAAMCTNTTYE